MNWTTANEQQEDATFRVFMMLVAMVVLTVRTQRAPAFLELEGAVRYAAPKATHPSPDRLRHALFGLLAAVEAAAHRLKSMFRRADYELVNHAHTLAGSRREHVRLPADLCGLPWNRLDSS